MKIFCTTDTHGKIPPTVACDCILHAGDIYNGLIGSNQAKPEPNHPLYNWATAQSTPIIRVRGNHDIYDQANLNMVANDLTGSACVVENNTEKVTIVGVGWSGGAYYDLPLDYDLTQVCESAFRVFDRIYTGGKVVLLTHYPPHIIQHLEKLKTTHGPGWTFRGVYNLIRIIKPDVVVYGHIHQYRLNEPLQYFDIEGVDREMLMINPGPRGGILNLTETTCLGGGCRYFTRMKHEITSYHDDGR